MIHLGFPLFSTLDFLFSRWGFSLLFFYFWDFTWIRGFLDGVKPPKGQDCGRSYFSYLHDRDRGCLKNRKCARANETLKIHSTTIEPRTMLSL